MDRVSPRRLGLLLTLLLAGPSAAGPFAATATLDASPNRCIALHQGQRCYVTTTLQWTASRPGRYCLHQVGAPAPLTCWDGAAAGRHVVDLESAESLRFELRVDGDPGALASAGVEVAWVYNARRRSKASWRLF